MNDPLIVAGVLLMSVALLFTLRGRREPRRERPRAPVPALAVPQALPGAPFDDEDTTLVTSALEIGVLPPPPRPKLPSLLAEALAEAHEASSASEPPKEAALDSSALRILYQRGAEQDEPTGPVPLFELAVHGDTDQGLLRKQNEDALLLLPEQGLVAVADGMGGYSGGQVASSLAIDSLRESFSNGVDAAELLATGFDGPRRALEVATAMQRANDVVFRAAQTRPELRDMGTTLIALRYLPQKQRLYVGHVGDSRCYRLRGGELRQLTTDHALKELGLAGPRENDLFKAIGIESEIAVDVVVDKPLPGDTYLLCSDGLTKMVKHERIRELLSQGVDEEAIVYDLIEEANDAGGRDNVTVVVAKVGAPTAGANSLGGVA